MAPTAALLPVPRKPSRAAMGTQETVAFRNSSPGSGRRNRTSWKRPVVTDSKVPIADGDQKRELPFAGIAQNGKADVRYVFGRFSPELRLCSGRRH
jgi:hypothetical protein